MLVVVASSNTLKLHTLPLTSSDKMCRYGAWVMLAMYLVSTSIPMEVGMKVGTQYEAKVKHPVDHLELIH